MRRAAWVLGVADFLARELPLGWRPILAAAGLAFVRVLPMECGHAWRLL